MGANYDGWLTFISRGGISVESGKVKGDHDFGVSFSISFTHIEERVRWRIERREETKRD